MLGEVSISREQVGAFICSRQFYAEEAHGSYGPATIHDKSPPFTKEQARAIVAPLYEALNEPQNKDVSGLLAQATNPDYRSCSTLTDCLDRERLAEVFKAMGKMVPNLRWTFQNVWTIEDRIVVLGEASGTPTETFFGVEPTGRSFRRISLDIFTVKNGKLS